jgi:hypothetical protein
MQLAMYGFAGRASFDGNPNTSAFTVWPLVIYLLTINGFCKTPLPRYKLLLPLSLLLLTIALTGSRQCLFSISIFYLVSVLLADFYRLRRLSSLSRILASILLALSATVTGLALSGQLNKLYALFFERGNESGVFASFIGRSFVWDVYLQALLANLKWIGASDLSYLVYNSRGENIYKIVDSVPVKITAPHSFLIEIVLEHGVLMLLVFLALFICVLLKRHRCSDSSTNLFSHYELSYFRVSAIACLSALIMASVDNFFVKAWGAPSFVFWICLGGLCRSCIHSERTVLSPQRPDFLTATPLLEQ